MLTVMVVVGTRPEFIKLSEVIRELDEDTHLVLVHTGQHYTFELNQIFFEDLGIRKPDFFLGCAEGTAIQCIANILVEVDKLLEQVNPDALLIYGDTNSCLCTYSAKRRKVPIFHMEAGNRSFDARTPEEINRKLIDHLSDVNLTITEHARRHLIGEGLRSDMVFKVGSSMPQVIQRHRSKIEQSSILKDLKLTEKDYILVSIHREENVTNPRYLDCLRGVLGSLVEYFPIKKVLFSAHPRTRQLLGKFETYVDHLVVVEPFGFTDFVKLQQNAYCTLSDSGTLFEESNILRFPAVTLRDAHERPEGVDEATLVISGWDFDSIMQSIKLVTKAAKETNLIEDYDGGDVGMKVSRIIQSYVGYVNKSVWRKF